MNIREKLVELLTNSPQLDVDDWTTGWEEAANYLIAHGVTAVVRCKDCKWLYDEMDDYCCRSHRGLVRICENSFCSYGERKDGDGNG